MTELFLKKDGDDWQRVYFSTSGSGFRLTRENPYFTQSESYTLDVSLPTEILANRQFFGNLQRIDTAKRATSYQCRLMVDGISMLDGTAKVTQVTESTVKIQLLGGNSELNFLSNEENLYIDEMDLGYYSQPGVWLDYKGNRITLVDHCSSSLVFMTAYDETNDRLTNVKSLNLETGKWHIVVDTFTDPNAPQPNLLYIIKAILYKQGYALDRCDIDCEPWNRLFIASAKSTPKISHALPHWRAGEFLSEVCRFFNCTLIVDSNAKTVSLVNSIGYFRDATKMIINPIDEYTAEMDDDGAKALASSNIGYDMSGSSEHSYDCLADNLRETIPHKDYTSYADARFDSIFLPGNERRRYIYRCPTGKFIVWESDDEKNPLNGLFVQVDHFEPVVRDYNSDNGISLKICPVALTFSIDALRRGNDKTMMTCVIPSLENPTGNESSLNDDESVSAQDLIEGNETVEKADKEDRLQVMFVDDVPQYSEVNGDPTKKALILMPFTDYGYIPNADTPHRSWSLALTRSDAAHYLGQLHQSGFTFNVRAKHTIRFIADTMPDPNGIFQIRGKLYGCEKIEANVNENGFDKLMTGYFYEMTQ